MSDRGTLGSSVVYALILIFAFLFIVFTDTGVGVEIREMRVPPVIQSGTVDHVILDCNYDVTYMEGKQLDIKWFFGDDHQPFYQWLPGHRRVSKNKSEYFMMQATGLLQLIL